MPIRRAAIAVALLLAGAVEMPLGSQAPARTDQTYTSATTAILVDVVVRDRKGRPVTDLDAGDFELLEDNAVQKVDTFSRVSRGSGIGVNVAWRPPPNTTLVMTSRPAGPAANADPESPEATLALVFDHLSPESLRLVQRAMQAVAGSDAEMVVAAAEAQHAADAEDMLVIGAGWQGGIADPGAGRQSGLHDLHHRAGAGRGDGATLEAGFGIAP